MDTQLTFCYDRIGDILWIGKCQSYRGQDSDDIENMVVARLNPDTNEVEGFEVLFASTRILSYDPFRLNIPVAPGTINGWPAAPEFNCLVASDSEWLTVPQAAVVGMELDVRPPQRPTYPGNRPADISRFELTIDSTLPLTR
jgi:hypothetical protein